MGFWLLRAFESVAASVTRTRASCQEKGSYHLLRPSLFLRSETSSFTSIPVWGAELRCRPAKKYSGWLKVEQEEKRVPALRMYQVLLGYGDAIMQFRHRATKGPWFPWGSLQSQEEWEPTAKESVGEVCLSRRSAMYHIQQSARGLSVVPCRFPWNQPRGSSRFILPASRGIPADSDHFAQSYQTRSGIGRGEGERTL